MAEGKWITGLKSGLSLDEAARIVLPIRFDAVLLHLPGAVESAGADPEHVHQLRVATRRSAASLGFFGACLPEKRARQLRKALRTLRRAAGSARDWDVFFQLLQDAKPLQAAKAAPARDFLFGFASARRVDAQKQLSEAAAKVGESFREEADRIKDDSFDWQAPVGDMTLGKRALKELNELLSELDAQSTPPPTVYEALHQLRILGKQLRYSMELFADCFEAPFREELYPEIEQMQEILGHVTDAHVAAEHLQEAREFLLAFHKTAYPRFKAPIEAIRKACTLTISRERRRFLAWLPKWRKRKAEMKLEGLLR